MRAHAHTLSLFEKEDDLLVFACDMLFIAGRHEI